MSVRILFIAAALLVALSIAWGKRQSIQGLLAPPPPAPKPIQFDNGTVRELAPLSSAASSSDRPQIASGGLRKCFKGQQISYTNMECPPGSTEKPVSGPPVNIMPAQASAKPDESRSQDKTRPSLRGSLDLNRDSNLKDRMMERVIEEQK